MSPKNLRLHTAGLTALGLFALAPFGVAADTPEGALQAPSARVAPAPVRSVLLLKNGSLQEGLVSDGGTVYFIHNRSGKIPVPKTSVEMVGRSVREIYEFKLSRLPERDPDEHMKLARWCLTQRLNDEAKVQLERVVALSPRNLVAAHMLEKMHGAEERAALRDPAVAQASLELPAGRPDALDPAIIGRAQRDLGVSTLPQIPGLPTAQAVKRSTEFSHYVDPILQLRCAKCHNEQFAGSFRLVNYRSKRDRTPDALRANFDAILALIDWENLEKSELLASTLRPHGKGANARPVFSGSNNPEYRILQGWVHRLRTAQPVAAAPASRPAAAGAPEGEAFGAQRAGSLPPPLLPTPPSSSLDTRPQLAPQVDTVVPKPPGQYLSGSAGAKDPYAPPDAEFPAPYLAGGPKPKTPPSAQPSAPPSTLPPPLPGGPPGAPAANVPPGQPLQQAAPAAAGQPAAPKRKTKPLKLDPALLEKALMNRNGALPQQP